MPRTQIAKVAQRVKLAVESLESRRCLAFGAPDLTFNILSIDGGGGVDELVSITVAGGVVKFTDDAGLHATTIDPADVITLSISGGGGNDTLDLSGLAAVLPNVEYVILFGSDGDDTLKLPPSAAFGVTPSNALDDTCMAVGGPGMDTIIGSSAPDKIYGDAQSLNSAGGDDAADTITGGSNDDMIYGGGGGDTISGNGDCDLISGNGGNDTINTNSAASEVEYASGGGGQDTLNGGAGLDQLWGDDDKDVIKGFAGNDTLYGGASALDELDGGADEDNTWSNTSALDFDQPFKGDGPAGTDMFGTGGAGCD